MGEELLRIAEEMGENGIPEYDWSKIRDLEFQERLREKEGILGGLEGFQCSRCPDLVEHVRMHLTLIPTTTFIESILLYSTVRQSPQRKNAPTTSIRPRPHNLRSKPRIIT